MVGWFPLTKDGMESMEVLLKKRNMTIRNLGLCKVVHRPQVCRYDDGEDGAIKREIHRKEAIMASRVMDAITKETDAGGRKLCLCGKPRGPV